MDRVSVDYEDNFVDHFEPGERHDRAEVSHDPWLGLPLVPAGTTPQLWDTGSAAAAALDMVRTRVSTLMTANSWTTLAVTAPTAGCGTTTLAANLALSLSRRPETRVILIDFNMRRPALGAVFGIAGEASIEQFLSGVGQLPRRMLRPNANLAVLPNTQTVDHPSDLIQTTKSIAALGQLRQVLSPTFVIFDMPPMLESDEVLAFLPQLDCVLLAIGAETSTLEQVDLCERELSSRGKLLGVVLNRCKFATEYAPK